MRKPSGAINARKYAKGAQRSARSQLQLSARGYQRVLKLARTIADLAGSESIDPHHLAVVLQYRPKMELF